MEENGVWGPKSEYGTRKAGLDIEVLAEDDGRVEVIGEKKEFKKEKIIVASLTIALLLVVAALCVYLFAFGGWDNIFGNDPEKVEINGFTSIFKYDAKSNAFGFNDMFDSQFFPSYYSLEWFQRQDNSEGWIEHSTDSNGNPELILCSLNPLDVEDPITRTTLVAADNYPKDASVSVISRDAKYVAFAYDTKQLYRHSYFARWEICAAPAMTCKDLLATQMLTGLSPDADKDVRLVLWSPNYVDRVAYVWHNDLYVITDVSNIEGSTIRITQNGADSLTISGAPDWVYEEEILSSNSASYWSPDSSSIAFMQFDQSPLPQYPMLYYNYPNTYPNSIKLPYPCPGSNHSVASLWVHDIVQNTTKRIFGTDVFADSQDYLITQVEWIDTQRVSFLVMNRLQTTQKLYIFDLIANTSTLVLTQNNPQDKWIEITQNLLFIKNAGKTYFVQLYPYENFMHLSLKTIDGNVLTQLTSGNWDVTGISSYDPTTQTLYFMSRQADPKQIQLYSLKITFTATPPEIVSLSATDGYYGASFSPSSSYYLLYYYGTDIPTSTLVNSTNSELIAVLESNEDVETAIAGKAMPTKEYRTFLSADGATELQGFVMYPPGFDAKGNTKYPVLMYYYGGPGSQSVSDMWSSSHWDFHSYMSSSLGFIIVVVDNRGTCCLGQDFLQSTYLKLGVLETEDQLAVASQLSEMSYVDSQRIGSWGWSYGGFLTCRLASANNSLIKATAAVAPVTDWRLYDSVYTERYMRDPDTNKEGYDESSVLGRASEVDEGTSHLVIHGTGDDNVHFQNSADWVTELVANGVNNFHTMYYPDKAHSLSGLATRKHLYNLLANFFTTNLAVRRPPVEETSLFVASKKMPLSPHHHLSSSKRLPSPRINHKYRDL